MHEPPRPIIFREIPEKSCFVIFIPIYFLVLVLALVLVSNMSIIKTLGIGLELFPISEMKNQDTSWYWSQKKFRLKTCLGIGL